MDAKEFEIVLHECEKRLDRLRALYEQYFQGLERLEPMVPKKELQRSVQLLRRNQPRNTALRFRYQSMLQKYTTYQNYWNRIARQIEEGTYRRDLMKIRRQREDARTRRRERDNPEATHNPADGFSLDVDLDSMDIDAELAAATEAASASADRLFAKDDILSAIDGFGPTPSVLPGNAVSRASLSPFATPSKRPDASDARPLTPLATLGSLPPRPPAAPATSSATPSEAQQGTAGAPPGGAGPKRTPAGGASKAPAPVVGGVSRPPAPKPRGPAKLDLDLGGLAAAPRSPSSPRRSASGPSAGGRPQRTAAASRAPAQRPAASTPRRDDPGLRNVYEKLVAARKKNNERVDNLRFETVKKSIEKQLPKLQQKHKGKNIDFEVVIRNGKVGLKPIVK